MANKERISETSRDTTVWDIKYKEPKIDRGLTYRFAVRHRGSVRISQGLFYTNEEWERKKEAVLAKGLP